jgi:hypothetical protein
MDTILIDIYFFSMAQVNLCCCSDMLSLYLFMIYHLPCLLLSLHLFMIYHLPCLFLVNLLAGYCLFFCPGQLVASSVVQYGL